MYSLIYSCLRWQVTAGTELPCPLLGLLSSVIFCYTYSIANFIIHSSIKNEAQARALNSEHIEPEVLDQHKSLISRIKPPQSHNKPLEASLQYLTIPHNIWGFPKIRVPYIGTLFWGPYNKDPTI